MKVLIFLFTLVIGLIFLPAWLAEAQTPGKDGAKTVSGTETVNIYTRVPGNLSAGTTSVPVVSVAGITAGDLVMIYQAQGATISTTNDSAYGGVTAYNNCGYYEWKGVQSVNTMTNTITLVSGLANSYTAAGNVQVVRVPQYTTLTVNASGIIQATSWDGQVGGIVAVHVQSSAAVNGTVRANSAGFRGGATENNSNGVPNSILSFRSTDPLDGGEKGESIAGLPSDFASGRYGRGAPANGGGGGNSHNGGGGGGANGNNGNSWTGHGVMPSGVTGGTGAWPLDPGWFVSGNTYANSSGGGRAGYSYSAVNRNALTNGPGRTEWGGDYRQEKGGRGGHPLAHTACGRIFFGGGGGAGDMNNGNGGAGGNGGGIVIVDASSLSGSGSLQSNGANGANTISTGHDAPGGGGGGGTIVVKASTITLASMTANGGNGGIQTISITDEAEGPGGGGGGGYIAVSTSGATLTASGGTGGTTNATSVTEFPRNGATNGANGSTEITSIGCLMPVELVAFTAKRDADAVNLAWKTATEINNYGFEVQRSVDAQTWSVVEFILGAGTSQITRSYDYRDVLSPSLKDRASLYYRLKQIDRDGSHRFSHTLAVGSNLTPRIDLEQNYPNPFATSTRIDFMLSSDCPVTLAVFNMLGQEVHRLIDRQETRAGFYQVKFSSENLPSGKYLYRLTTPYGTINRSMFLVK